ncbi:efflux RND transporter periplasmic adaptor subunit [Aquimarina intermedia]|nr:efflux RND transporter periplasmic adaptor subunit [Aquimarina intermedia]
MDKKIEKKKITAKKILVWGMLSLIVVFILYLTISANSKSTVKIEYDKLSVATVKKLPFQEYIIEMGEVVPNRTFYLDAVEGGNIINVFKESGAIVKKGMPILELENANLKLNVLSQENSLNEQINRVRTTRLQLDQNFLAQKTALAEIENFLHVQKPKFYRDSILFNKGIISKQEFEKTQADYRYNLKRKQFTNESFKKDSASRVLQLEQLRSSERNMIENLSGVKQILDNLIVKAPIDGQLYTGQLQEGQNINKGERIGQVDVLGTYKVRVPIDEIYLSRIKKGLNAKTDINGESYLLTVRYIYPTVENGEFMVDMEFINEVPEGVISGQSLRLRIELGQSSEELAIPVGGFYNNTGGNWLFVLNEGTNEAEKRTIELGKKNIEYYQVLSGLEVGEKVIISSYDSFGDNERIVW